MPPNGTPKAKKPFRINKRQSHRQSQEVVYNQQLNFCPKPRKSYREKPGIAPQASASCPVRDARATSNSVTAGVPQVPYTSHHLC
jgi:hypothetical protein